MRYHDILTRFAKMFKSHFRKSVCGVTGAFFTDAGCETVQPLCESSVCFKGVCAHPDLRWTVPGCGRKVPGAEGPWGLMVGEQLVPALQ